MPTRKSTTVTKALNILDLFLNQNEGLSVTQIHNLSVINMSTVLRLCATLENSGYLKRNGRGIYFVGHQIERLSQVYRHQFSLDKVIRPVLTTLRDETEESASFYIISGNQRTCLFRVNSENEIRHVVEEGARLPLAEGVVGPVLLAYSGKRGPQYDKIRKEGYLIAKGRKSYTASVAAPVFKTDGSLAGALVVSGLSVRFTAKKRVLALNLILSCSQKLSVLLPA